MRKNLEDLLYDIWEEYFADIPRKNLVLIKYGKYSKARLGSIKWVRNKTGIKKIYKTYRSEHESQDDERITLITLTRFFSDPEVPEEILKATIAHELVHYAHGFNSPLPKLYNHPHRGKVVEIELERRGLYSMYAESEQWLKDNWRGIISKRKKTAIRRSLF